MEEIEHYLEPAGLFMVDYLAESPVTAVLIPPLFEEHPRTRKLFVNLARHLASAGIRAIRFDYAGTGLSLGSPHDLSPESTVRDLDTVRQYAERSFDSKILLIGFRYGGFAATQFNLLSNRQFPCLFLEPITDLAKYCDACLRIALANQLVVLGAIKENRKALVARLESGRYVLVDGYPISPELYAQCMSLTQESFSRAVSTGNSEAIFWKSERTHTAIQELDIPSTFVAGIRSTWDNIRFIDNRPDPLFGMTLDWCKKHAI